MPEPAPTLVSMSRIVQYSRYGGPEVLQIVEVDEPHASAGQVRIAVRSAGLNAFDYKVRRSNEMLPNRTLPARQGSEFAGVIDEIGADVVGRQLGEEVLGWIGFGAQADYVVVSATNVAPKPANLDWATAGGIGLVGNTAKRSLDAMAVGTGDTILVSAAAGGVGSFVAQLALRAGATVIGSASESHHEFLRALGVIPLTYGPGLVERIRAAAPAGIDAVLDNFGEETVDAAIELGVDPARINSIVYYAGATKYGISNVGGGGKTAHELAKLAGLVADGSIVVPIAATFALAEVQGAYELLETGHVRGKVILTL